MSKCFTCPFCQKGFALHFQTYHEHCFDAYGNPAPKDENNFVKIELFTCPYCNKVSIKSEGVGDTMAFPPTPLRPNSLAKHFPDYIPEAIRNDYEEACAVVTLSPKASATLSRRCLQGMIRDFWGISGKKSLYQEISAIEGMIPAQQWKVIDGIRRIGNIGAHMEKDINLIIDIDPNEAKKLIKLLEQLLEQWYINRHEQEMLYAEIIDIDHSKQEQKQKLE